MNEENYLLVLENRAIRGRALEMTSVDVSPDALFDLVLEVRRSHAQIRELKKTLERCNLNGIEHERKAK